MADALRLYRLHRHPDVAEGLGSRVVAYAVAFGDGSGVAVWRDHAHSSRSPVWIEAWEQAGGIAAFHQRTNPLEELDPKTLAGVEVKALAEASAQVRRIAQDLVAALDKEAGLHG